jgi:hypothetical protein
MPSGPKIIVKIDVEGFAADRLDDPADPVDIDAIFPSIAGIEQQG